MVRRAKNVRQVKEKTRHTCSRGKIKNSDNTYTTNPNPNPIPIFLSPACLFLYLLISNSFKHPELFHKGMNWLFRCLFVRQDLTPRFVKAHTCSGLQLYCALFAPSRITPLCLDTGALVALLTKQSAIISVVIVNLNLSQLDLGWSAFREESEE